MTTTYDVAIIGCGPIGAMAANLFGAAGLRTIVIERESAPYAMPRAVHIDHEMMRLFNSVGLAETLLPQMREAQGHVHIGADGGVIRYLGTAGLPKLFGWANDYFFYQPELEQTLRDAMARYPHVTLRSGTTMTALQQDQHGVGITVASGGTMDKIAARYAVACDGASSPTRKLLGIPLIDLDFDEPWLVVDAAVDGPITFPDFSGVPAAADLQSVSVMLCDPKRPATLVPGRGQHRRWEFMLLPGETDAEMVGPERIAALIAPYVEGRSYRLTRAAVYRFHGLVAERWQDGRVFLAGDAAHQTPPFFGQGMCHGMRDVANLAWKLGRVVSGKSAPALLDSYQVERDPHVRAVVGAAMQAGRYICERDPAVARERDLRLREAMGKPAPATAGDLIPPIRDGIVAPGAGERFVHPYVTTDDGRRALLDQITGGGFVLIVARADLLSAETIADWTRIGGRIVTLDQSQPGPGVIRVADTDRRLQNWLTQHDAAAMILRPDFYVYGYAGDQGSLDQLTRRWLDQLSPQ